MNIFSVVWFFQPYTTHTVVPHHIPINWYESSSVINIGTNTERSHFSFRTHVIRIKVRKRWWCSPVSHSSRSAPHPLRGRWGSSCPCWLKISTSQALFYRHILKLLPLAGGVWLSVFIPLLLSLLSQPPPFFLSLPPRPNVSLHFLSYCHRVRLAYHMPQFAQ